MFFWFWKFSKNQNLRFLYFWNLKKAQNWRLLTKSENHTTLPPTNLIFLAIQSPQYTLPDFTDDNELLPIIKQHPQGTKKYLMGSICK
jgi:hypothetical protein